PWSDELLQGKQIVLNSNGPLQKIIADSLSTQKAIVRSGGDAFQKDKSASSLSVSVNSVFQGSVFDATGLQKIADLKSLYSFFHGLRGQLGFNHRVVILSKTSKSPEGRAIEKAISSFARSLSREFGPEGINVNVLLLETYDDKAKAEALALQSLPVLSFFLSDFCAFVTGQIIPLHLEKTAKPLPLLAGSLAGKTALVTGAAQGIGYSICRRLAEEGAHVIALDRPQNEEALRELCLEIEGDYLLATIGKNHDDLIERLTAQSESVDIIVHNAGITRDRSLFGMSESEWDDVLNINLEAVIDITTEVLRRGLLKTGGRIVCMASVVGISGNFGQSNYSASKAGLIGYVEAMAEHLASIEGTVNAIAPGFIETNMTAKIPFVQKQFARRLSSLSQGGQPDDVADMVTFLASPCSQAINGQTIRVCGGSFLGA
ncbi:MAG: 3-oxoacyl-ACP reductase, partial [Proteobacteria bacterium]